MKNFNLYARYYDLLYQDKDYNAEVNYVNQLIKANTAGDSFEILDLGCGTGKHDFYFSRLGHKVDGVDISPEMISQAKEKFGKNPGLHFYQGNVTNWRHPEEKKYDVVLSLFHVLSYQNTNDNVLDTFNTAHRHLKPGGLFIYDCWYGPGIFDERPSVRIKRLENNDLKIQRISEPVHHANENIVEVQYEVLMLDKLSGKTDQINELHRMRYFFLPELNYFSANSGFTDMQYFEWLRDTEPAISSWNIVAIQKKPLP